MKTLRDYEVTNALYQADTGPEAQVGDQIRLYLDTEANPGFPEYVVGVIQHPISKVNCDSATSYIVEYDEADLLGAAALLRPQDVIDGVVVTATEVLDAALTAEIAARIAADAILTAADVTLAAADAAQFQSAAVANSTGDTTITVPAGCDSYTVFLTITGVASTRNIALALTNAAAGCRVVVNMILPATDAIVVNFRSATVGGTILDTITTDTSGDGASAEFGFTTVWNKLQSLYPN